MITTRLFPALVLLAFVMRGTSFADTPGILLLAHGGNAQWNAHVTELAEHVDRLKPTEVAFGMATRGNIQAAVDRLTARGVSEIVAVPLFVSSWSTVISSTEYLLGQRPTAPPELAMFAKMNHGAASNNGSGSNGHDSHGAQDGEQTATSDATSPISARVPIRMTPALSDHPIVADILLSRARSISRDPAGEAVIIVAHGPNGDEDNQRWLADMASLARQMAQAEKFASIDYLTLRDDAPTAVRDAATSHVRELVSRRTEEGRRVLVIPLLVSFGGIERGLQQRLEGLPYTIPDKALVPDERLVEWVLRSSEPR